MSNAMKTADDHLRQALVLLRDEETQRVEEFNRQIAELRQRIKILEDILSPPPRQYTLREITQPMASVSAPPRSILAPDPIRNPEQMIADLAKAVRGKSQLEALIEIARRNGGILRTAEVKPILLKAGLIKGNPKNASGHVFGLLRDDDRLGRFGVRFEKLSPGVYKMMPSTEPERDGNLREERSENNVGAEIHPEFRGGPEGGFGALSR
jgi:hypothetical protein